MASGAGFPPSARLRKPDEFRNVTAKGRRSRRALLSAAYVASEPGPRLGLAIAKKSVADSSQRNRIKRLIREAFRHERPNLPAVDIVFFAGPGAGRLDNDALRALISDVWTQVRERCAKSSSSRSAPTSVP